MSALKLQLIKDSLFIVDLFYSIFTEVCLIVISRLEDLTQKYTFLNTRGKHTFLVQRTFKIAKAADSPHSAYS